LHDCAIALLSARTVTVDDLRAVDARSVGSRGYATFFALIVDVFEIESMDVTRDVPVGKRISCGRSPTVFALGVAGSDLTSRT